MEEKKPVDFQEVLDQHQKIIYYLINKYGIRDAEQEFYQEGIIALWKAMKSYDMERGKFSSYAYFLIEKSLLSLIRTRNRQIEKQEACIHGIAMENDKLTLVLNESFDPYLLNRIEVVLTANQMKWFRHAILYDKSYKEIAVQENTSENAVKNWARLAKPKLKRLLVAEEYITN